MTVKVNWKKIDNQTAYIFIENETDNGSETLVTIGNEGKQLYAFKSAYEAIAANLSGATINIFEPSGLNIPMLGFVKNGAQGPLLTARNTGEMKTLLEAYIRKEFRLPKPGGSDLSPSAPQPAAA